MRSDHDDRRARLCGVVTMAPVVLLALLIFTAVRPAHGHGDIMHLGSSQVGGGQLIIEPGFDFHLDVFLPLRAELGGQSIYDDPSLRGPNFAWVLEPRPGEGIYPLKATTQLRMTIVSVAAGARVVIGTQTLDTAGASATLGTFSSKPDDHIHPVWRLILPTGVVGRYAISFKLSTTAAGYSESPVYTLTLNNGTPPTATATPTITQSPTITPTADNTATSVPTATASTTPTQTSEPSPTPTRTATPTVSATATPTPTATPTSSVARGDGNCDRRITAADVAAILLDRNQGEPGVCGSDVDRNGRVNETDLELLVPLLFRS